MFNIVYANACYSGGGIYIYIGKLDNGTFFIASDEGDLTIMDTEPTFDYDMDYFNDHVVEYVDSDTVEFSQNFKAILNWILTNKPEGNYSSSEIYSRILKY